MVYTRGVEPPRHPVLADSAGKNKIFSMLGDDETIEA